MCEKGQALGGDCALRPGGKILTEEGGAFEPKREGGLRTTEGVSPGNLRQSLMR